MLIAKRCRLTLLIEVFDIISELASAAMGHARFHVDARGLLKPLADRLERNVDAQISQPVFEDVRDFIGG